MGEGSKRCPSWLKNGGIPAWVAAAIMCSTNFVPGGLVTAKEHAVSDQRIESLANDVKAKADTAAVQSKASKDAMNSLAGTVGNIEQRVSTLEKSQQQLATNQQALLKGQASMRSSLASIKDRLDRMQGD